MSSPTINHWAAIELILCYLKEPPRHGILNYLTVTRSNIAYSITVLSQYMSSPIVNHWAAVEHVLCYLKEAPRRGILYKKHGHIRMECFSNIDWVGSKEDKRSTLGYCVFF